MSNKVNLTQTSLDLFLSLAKDAGNWGGCPLTDLNTHTRGNLTQLKIAGLITTWTDSDYPRCVFAQFTDAGRELAKKHGVNIDWTRK